MNASLIRHGCGGIVRLTDPVVLVETGLMYMLSVYHKGSVACHLPSSPLLPLPPLRPNTSSPLHQNQQSENQSVTQEDTHTHKHTPWLYGKTGGTGENDRKGREGMTAEVKG